MKLTLQVQLLPNEQQKRLLLETMGRFNKAASFAAELGFAAGVFSQPSIHHLAYYAIREHFGLSAQLTVRAIGKACEAFARDKTVCPVFRLDGAITYDERILSFKDCHRVSILVVTGGRQMIPYVFGKYQQARLDRIRGQADLIYRDGKFYLYCTIHFDEPPPVEPSAWIGIDLGIVNIATDSTGKTFSGDKIDRNRKRRTTARKQYQRKGTKNAKRRLKRMSGKQRRFQTWVNHNVSKRLVDKAKTQSAGIVLEELKGIRSRLEDTVSRRFRRRLGNWGFFQLRTFVEYKARMAGVPVVFADPRNTSRTCSRCGHCEKANRKSQSKFSCKHCGFSLNADFNAALNLSTLGPTCNPASKVSAYGQ